ncbi:MAG: hypothetical protein ACE5NJ_12880 [Thermodesulfobacteriota bacterium]
MKLEFIVCSLTASCILFAVHSLASEQVQQRHDLTIIYTTDVLGEIEPCG